MAPLVAWFAVAGGMRFADPLRDLVDDERVWRHNEGSRDDEFLLNTVEPLDDRSSSSMVIRSRSSR